MPDIFLYAGEASPSDVRLRDPTVSAATIYTLVADTVAFVAAGIATRLTARLVVNAGAYTDTGNAASFKALLSGGVGAYTETGRSAALQAVLRPASASYVLTGYPAAGLSITVLLDWLRIDSGDHSRFNDILTN